MRGLWREPSEEKIHTYIRIILWRLHVNMKLHFTLPFTHIHTFIYTYIHTKIMHIGVTLHRVRTPIPNRLWWNFAHIEIFPMRNQLCPAWFWSVTGLVSGAQSHFWGLPSLDESSLTIHCACASRDSQVREWQSLLNISSRLAMRIQSILNQFSLCLQLSTWNTTFACSSQLPIQMSSTPSCSDAKRHPFRPREGSFHRGAPLHHRVLYACAISECAPVAPSFSTAPPKETASFHQWPW